MSRPEPRPAAADEGLKLDRLQRDLLLSLIKDFIAAAPQADGGAHYRALEEAVARMEVPPDLARSVGSIAEVALSTGRVRNAFGPGAELALAALFNETPRGKAIARSLHDLNRALARLKDHPLAEIHAALRKPGVYTLTIGSTEGRIVLRFDHDGATVESVETGAG